MRCRPSARESSKPSRRIGGALKRDEETKRGMERGAEDGGEDE